MCFDVQQFEQKRLRSLVQFLKSLAELLRSVGAPSQKFGVSLLGRIDEDGCASFGRALAFRVIVFCMASRLQDPCNICRANAYFSQVVWDVPGHTKPFVF